MKINWKARFKNKAFLITFVTLIVAFVYQMLGLFRIVPPVSEDALTNIIMIVINFMANLGVIVDPTTSGVSDSERAMTYFTDADVRVDE